MLYVLFTIVPEAHGQLIFFPLENNVAFVDFSFKV